MDMRPNLHSVALLLSRATIGAYFAIAGWNKIFNMGVSVFYVKGFLSLKPAWLPELLGRPYGYAIPYLELVLGLLLVVGLFGRTAAWATFAVMASIIIAQVSASGTLADPPKPFNANLIFLSIIFLLAVFGPGALSLDALWLKMRKGKPA